MIGNRMKWMRYLLLSFICLVWLSLPVLAEEGVALEVSSADLQMGMSTEITITVYDGLKVDKMSMTDYDAFEILNQRQSSSTQFINGKKSQMKQYILTAKPKREGTFTLQVTVNDGKTDYRSEAVTVTVSPKDTSLAEGAEDIFIRTELSKDRIYMGEPLVLRYDLYTSYNVEGFEFAEPFSLDDAMMEETPKEELASNYLTIGDVEYIRYEAKKLIINPIHTGEIQLPGREFRVYVSTGDVFGSYKTRYLETEEAELEVRPLPTEHQPANFSGLVGNYNVKAAYDKDEVKAGDAVTLTVTITGSGNLEVLDTLFEDEGEGLKIYETDQGVIRSIQGDSVSSSRTFEVILVPGLSGEVTVPELSVDYFNTEKELYDTLEVPGTVIKVSGEVAVAADTPVINSGSGTLTVSQITYPEDHSDAFVLYLRKDILTAVGVGLAILLIAAMMVRWGIGGRHQSSKLRAFRQRINKAATVNDLYDEFADILHEMTGCHIKSLSDRERHRMIKDTELAQALDEVSSYFEYGRYYKEKPFKELKQWLFELLKRANVK